MTDTDPDYGIPHESAIPASRRLYLALIAMRHGADTDGAIQSVTAYAEAHPELDMNETKTWAEWEAEQKPRPA